MLACNSTVSWESLAGNWTFLHHLQMEAFLRPLPYLFSASLSHPVSRCSLVWYSWPWCSYSIFLTRMERILYLLFHSLGLRVVSAHQFPGTLWFQSVFPHLGFISQGKIKIRKIKFSETWNSCDHSVFSLFFLYYLTFCILESSARSGSPSSLPSFSHQRAGNYLGPEALNKISLWCIAIASGFLTPAKDLLNSLCGTAVTSPISQYHPHIC